MDYPSATDRASKRGKPKRGNSITRASLSIAWLGIVAVIILGDVLKGAM